MFSNLLNNRNQLVLLGIIAFILALPAFFINLGITPLIEDEAIRALVTLEMDISGNYLTPTVGGSFYYNKPPLFNWIVLLFFKAGGCNELMLRVPVVISLLLFGLTIFLAVRKHLGNRVAFTSALIFVTCGRILTYESLKGLIDIMFCWILFSSFVVLYNGLKNQKYFFAYIISYVLTAIAFLLKGLPAIYFQMATLLVLVGYRQRWKGVRTILSVPHAAGILVFLIILGSYYVLYFNSNPGSFKELTTVLFEQNTRRTAFRFGLLAMVEHLFTYPIEMMGHFLPWTLLVVYLFRKNSRKLLSHDFIICGILVFMINIIPYWTSPESFARYILMLVPILYIVFVYLFENEFPHNLVITKVLNRIFLVCFLLILILSFSIPFLPATAGRNGLVWKTIFLVVSISIIIYFYTRQPHNMLIYAGIFLLVVRIGFDWFVLPDRVEHMEPAKSRADAKQVGLLAHDNTVYVYGKQFRDYDEYKPKYIDFFYKFYISATSKKIILNSCNPDTSSYFVIKPEEIRNKPHQKYLKIFIGGDQEPREVIRFR